jgi:hypothetical protein
MVLSTAQPRTRNKTQNTAQMFCRGRWRRRCGRQTREHFREQLRRRANRPLEVRHSLTAERRTAVLRRFMELVGLEPATSWVRSRRSQPESGLTNGFPGLRVGSPNTFPNSLQPVSSETTFGLPDERGSRNDVPSRRRSRIRVPSLPSTRSSRRAPEVTPARQQPRLCGNSTSEPAQAAQTGLSTSYVTTVRRSQTVASLFSTVSLPGLRTSGL